MILVAQYLQHIDWEDWDVCVMTAIRADTKIDLLQMLLGMSRIMYVGVNAAKHADDNTLSVSLHLRTQSHCCRWKRTLSKLTLSG